MKFETKYDNFLSRKCIENTVCEMVAIFSDFNVLILRVLSGSLPDITKALRGPMLKFQQ